MCIRDSYSGVHAVGSHPEVLLAGTDFSGIDNLILRLQQTGKLFRVDAHTYELISRTENINHFCLRSEQSHFHHSVCRHYLCPVSYTHLNWTTIGIVIGGFLAFDISITGGIFFVKLVNLFSKKKINPLIGATGLSAVPMASRVANEIALKYDPKNHVLQYCMASNISGVIGSAVAAGVLISFLA